MAEYLSHELIGHISLDSTAIVGREKPAKKAAHDPKSHRKRGRPAKSERWEGGTLKRMDRQVHQTAEEAIPLIKLTNRKVAYLYELMDAASGA